MPILSKQSTSQSIQTHFICVCGIPFQNMSIRWGAVDVRDGWRYQIGWIFGKVPKGYNADFLPLYMALGSGFSGKNCNMIFQKLGGEGQSLFGIFRKFICFGTITRPLNARLGSAFVTFSFTFVRLIRRAQNAAFQKRKRRWLILAPVVWKHHFLCLKHLVLSSINQADRNRERASLEHDQSSRKSVETHWLGSNHLHPSLLFLQVRNFQHHYHIWIFIIPDTVT